MAESFQKVAKGIEKIIINETTEESAMKASCSEPSKESTSCAGDDKRVNSSEGGFYFDKIDLCLDCANLGVKYYNKNNKVQYELVSPVSSSCDHRNITHANFLARPRGSSSNSKPDLFFTEVDPLDKVIMCCILDYDPPAHLDLNDLGVNGIQHPKGMECRGSCNKPCSGEN